MYVNGMELVGYKRFKLSGIDKVTINPKSPLQIVIGTNGSGKSSLLEALSPYPQSKNDFNRGGKKTQNIEHNNDVFNLTSTFNGTAKHSFVKNGKELNPGGTATVQKDLVEKELGFDVKLHELVTGQTKFTSMSPSQRREWITNISSLDLNYALNLHKTVKTKLRDTQGTLRLSEERLAKDSKLLLDNHALADLNEQSQRLNEQIMFHVGIGNINVSHADKEMLHRLAASIMDKSNSILKTEIKFDKKYGFKSRTDIVSTLQKITNDIDVKRALVSEYEEMLSDTEETLRQLETEGAVDINGLENKLSVLYEAMSKVDTRSDRFTIEGDLRAVVSDTRSLRITISELVSSFTGASIEVPERKLWGSHRARLGELEAIYMKDKDVLAKLTIRLNHMTEAKEAQCPKCKYLWKPGVSEQEYAMTLANLDKIKAKLKDTKSMLERQSIIVGNIDTRASEYKRIAELSSAYPRLRPFWLYITDCRYVDFDTNPSDILTAYEEWSLAVEAADRLHNLKAEVSSVECVINRIKSIGDHADIKLFTNKQKSLKGKISSLHETLDRLNKESIVVTRYREQHDKHTDAMVDIVNMVNEFNRLQLAVLDQMVDEFNKESLKNAQINLSGVVKRLNDAETAVGIVNDLKSYIAKLKNELIGLKALEASLSPNEGIIAKSMGGFINTFTDQLNSIIGEVWDYDMQILPCGIDGGEVDYRFPLEVPDSDQITTDISKGSNGQKEVIDFAFMLAVMVYLDLKDYPLLLDEPGSTFDETHRLKLIGYIKWLLDAKQASQIWMVSHFAADHGGLSNAEVCVLNPANVTLPEVYNEHVSIS